MKYIIIRPLIIISTTCCLTACSFLFKHRAKTNVILVTLDTTRADRLHCYGYEHISTPHLDRIAEEGVLFRNAYTCVPVTLPAHASLMTGLLPPEHGLHMNGGGSLPTHIVTLAERFNDAGYATGAFLGSFVLHRKFGLHRGFDMYDDEWASDQPAGSLLQIQRDGRFVMKRSLQWIADHRTKPFFCWIHLYDPHTPYEEHADIFGDTYTERPYDAEIAYVDLQIGALLDFLNAQRLTEDTLLIIVGDHGESFGEHEEYEHGLMVYNATIHVPLLIMQPEAITTNRIIDHRVGFPDIHRTIAEMVPGDKKSVLRGRSLWPALRGETLPATDIYVESRVPYLEYGWSPLTALIADDWKYIESSIPELYNINEDPGEKTNRFEAYPEIVDAMAAGLQHKRTSFAEMEADTVQLSARDRRTLESLGYTVGRRSGISSSRPFGRLPDIKNHISTYNEVQQAHKYLRQGEAGKALTLLEKAVTLDPSNMQYRFLLAKANYQCKHWEAAQNAIHKIMQQQAQTLSDDLRIQALTLDAAIAASKGETDRAIETARAAVTLDPNSDRAVNSLAWILAVYTQPSESHAVEALEWAEKLMDEHGGRFNPQYLDTLAAAYASNGKYNAAVQTIDQAVVLAEKSGRPGLARKLRSRGIYYNQGKFFPVE